MVKTGLETLIENGFAGVRGLRLGFLGNQASVDSKLRRAVDLITGAVDVNLVRLFGPEHGFCGLRQDMADVGDSRDLRTGLPVVSLYGTSPEDLYPKKEQLEGLDVLLVDLPDIGSRYYTFAQSLGLAMEQAAKVGVKVIVLDRPNPLNGETIEGSSLEKSCRSFCGYAPVANRHGLTLGELAVLMNKGFGEGEDAIPPIDCELEVIRLQGWRRSMYYDETGLPWVMPSPNMPTPETALVYPGACLIEGTRLSEGRGTTRPFELIGAPFIDGFLLAETFSREYSMLEGALLRPASFEPQFQKHAKTACGGVQVHVTDRTRFQPYRFYLALIGTIAALCPSEFSWRTTTYEFVDKIPAIDLLFGSNRFRLAVDAGESLLPLFEEMEQFEKRYIEARADFLLYS